MSGRYTESIRNHGLKDQFVQEQPIPLVASKNTYFENRDADVENGHVATEGGGESEMHWVNSPDIYTLLCVKWVSQVALRVKTPSAHAGDTKDMGLIPGSGRSPGGGHNNPLQYLCLENPMDRGVWRTTVHRVTKSWT